MRTKTILNGVLTLALVVSISLFTSCSKEGVASKMLDKTAEEANKMCPMTVDYLTQLDSITHPESLTLAYYYTLNSTKAEIDSLMDWSKAKEMLISNVKSNPQLTPFFVFDVKFRHIYLSNEGLEIHQMEITPEDYK